MENNKDVDRTSISSQSSVVCYLIRYPSGKTFRLKGIFKLEPLGDWLVPMIHHENNKSTALDQRGIVEYDGKVVYSPRRNLDGLQPVMTEWLNDNPHWSR